MIHQELCKIVNFDQWYKHKSESVFENVMPKTMWNLKIQAEHQNSVRTPDPEKINKKKKCHLVDFAIRADQRKKINKSEKIYIYIYIYI